MARPAALEQANEMDEAASGRAVMAGAEGEPGLDLDADVVGADPRSVMRAVDEKTPRAHRLKTGQRIGDPVLLLGQPECDGARRLLVGGGGDKSANLILVGLEAEMGL